jgi:sugar-specific transcriptional regulator TrmB
MDVQLLEDIGLTKPQAAAYIALVSQGKSTAPNIASLTAESRSNTYKVLDKLCELGLATKDEVGNKVHYFPTSPAALEQLVRKQSAAIELRERKLNAAMPDMLSFYFQQSEQPSIRYFQGKEGIQQIFSDMLATSKDVYLLRSPEDVRFYDEKFFAEFRKKRSLLNIHTYALTVDIASAIHDPELDIKNKFIRTWLPADAYSGQVEWDIYGNKVALISYGNEALGIVIESAQIADSFRQVFQLLQKSH